MTAVTMTTPAGARRRTGATAGQLAGTWRLLRLALRRDRIMMPVWVLVLGGSFASVAGSSPRSTTPPDSAPSWPRR